MKFLYINFVVSLWLTAIVTLAMGIFVLIRNPKNTVNKTFAFYSFAIAWWSFCQIWLIACDKKLTALIWTRIEQVGVFFIPTFFVHFVISLLNIKNKRRFLVVSYSLSIIFAFLCATPLMIADAIPKETVKYVKYFATAGFAYHFAILFFVIIILHGLTWLYKEYKSSLGAKKNQLKYLFWSSLIGYVGGATNFLLVYGISIPFLNPFGTYALPLYISVVAYAILKYRLMDINVALTRIGVFTFVYILVLGTPFAITGWEKSFLINLFGNGWLWFPLVVFFILATGGPFLVVYLIRRTEASLFRERRHYQEVLNNLSESMVDIRDIDKLFPAITSTITEAVKIKFATIYLKTKEYNSFQLKNCYPAEAKSRFQEFIPLDDPLIRILEERKKPLLGEEIGRQEKISLDSGVIIPCFGKDGLIGFIILGAKQNNHMYTNDDLLVLETLSYNTSLAIENCTFWKEMENRQRMARIEEMHTFSYSLAHEIDNPMTILIRGIEVLRRDYTGYVDDEVENKKMIKWLDFMYEAAWRVSGMVKAVQEFGQKTSSEFKPVKLEKAIDTFLKLYIPHLKMSGVIFTKDIPEAFPLIRGVSQEIEQALIILAKNAVQALKDTKEKKIHLEAEVVNPGWIRIILTDNGPGIEKEKLLSIFTAFYTTKGTHEGTGMGLYNATQFIVERHKGKLWAESDGQGKGASFIIELPIAKDIKPEELKEEKKSNIIKFD
jgi:signal transduction histidine kinase